MTKVILKTFPVHTQECSFLVTVSRDGKLEVDIVQAEFILLFQYILITLYSFYQHYYILYLPVEF